MLGNASLEQLLLAQLSSVGRSPPEWDASLDDIELIDNETLTTVALPSLEHIAGDCLISASSPLASCTLGNAMVSGEFNVPSACR